MSHELKPRIWLSSPHMGLSEKEFVLEAFETNWIAPIGPHIEGLEADLVSYLGCPAAAALSSGTAALHLALILAGVKPGDEVICQSFTFSATANPIVYLGAIPIFVDSESQTGNMDPEILERAIQDRMAKGKKPKAIMPVHLYGMPAKMPEICQIAEKYDIPIIEDAAESLGSSIHGQLAGNFGTMAALSFNGNKIITTSGGGAFLSKFIEKVERAKFLATQARDPAPHYQHSEIGYNYRMSNVSAGIGRGQMKVLAERIKQRRNNYDFYHTHLFHIKEIGFIEEPQGYFSNRWLSVILINSILTPIASPGVDREAIRLALWEENIESRPLWKPLHLQPVFSTYPFYSSGVSETFFKMGLCLPSGSNLSTEDLTRVVDTIKRLFDR